MCVETAGQGCHLLAQIVTSLVDEGRIRVSKNMKMMIVVTCALLLTSLGIMFLGSKSYHFNNWRRRLALSYPPTDCTRGCNGHDKVNADDKPEEKTNELGGLDPDELGGLDPEDDNLILFTTDEENPVKFEIKKRDALMCKLVKNIIEGDQTAKEIEIKKVSGPILNLVVEYLAHHKGVVPAEIAKPIKSVQMDKIVECKWDAEFINKPTKKVIFQLILAANYMDIKSLLHLGCAKIATLIKGKSPEEIKKILGDEDGTRRRLKDQEWSQWTG